MKAERYCAEQIRAKEGETFLAVAARATTRFDPEYRQSRRKGTALRLPDLFSVLSTDRGTKYRIREVKFKLEERLIRKAITQLEVGAKQVKALDVNAEIDRVEIVIPLQGRKFTEIERTFLGEEISWDRYHLKLGSDKVVLVAGSQILPVTTLLLS